MAVKVYMPFEEAEKQLRSGHPCFLPAKKQRDNRYMAVYMGIQQIEEAKAEYGVLTAEEYERRKA